MWDTNTLWFVIAIVSIVILLGHILLGHFEERSPKWRKLLKYLVTVLVIILISILFGRILALKILGLAFIPVIYIHAVLLPRKGIKTVGQMNQNQNTMDTEDGATIFSALIKIK